MEVIILAGGLGTRLRSAIGNEIPKCMAPVAGRPFLWYLLKYLTRFDVSKVVLSVGYLREVIIEWVGKAGGDFPFVFDYAVEETPLGTGGGIRLALGKCSGKQAAVLNGDTFFDVDLALLSDQLRQSDSELAMALKPMQNFDRYGCVITWGDLINKCGYQEKAADLNNDNIQSFVEKKSQKAGKINGGVYVMKTKNALFTGLPDKSSFEKDVLETHVNSQLLSGFVHDGYFIDIGIPEDYVRANEHFKILFP